MKYYQIFICITIVVFLVINGVQSKSLGSKKKSFGYKIKFSSKSNLRDHSAFNNLVTEISSLQSYNYIETFIQRGASWKSKLVRQNKDLLYPTVSPLKQIKHQDNQDSHTEEQTSQNCGNLNNIDQENIYNRVPDVCNNRPPTQTSSTRFSYSEISTTTSGINCRRVMNSELNELGEIVDSVTLVCDPPTTTSRPTRKPSMKTTRRTTTTTAKPLVKVCKPVMNSYLNDKGEIIDTVTIVCEMKEVN